ncbi:MAG: LPS export ABC transporter periplasmic protein LptC [Rubrivivax sp.]
MSIDLDLPDLPEVPISLGAARRPAARPQVPWQDRAQERLVAYLPLLLMALMALSTWWLVKNAPRAPGVTAVKALTDDPDYVMQRFSLDRFGADGHLRVRIDGAELRHLPASDRIEIDQPRLRAVAADGRVMLAQARRAIGNGDASEVQLLGDAQVTTEDSHGDPLVLRGEFLHAFLVVERVSSNLPVQVISGAARIGAATLAYDHATGRIDLGGPVRAQMPARAVKR